MQNTLMVLLVSYVCVRGFSAINCFLSQTLSGEPLIVYEAKSQLTPIPAMCYVLECLLQAYYTMKLHGILVLLEISTTTGFFPYNFTQ